MNKRKKTKSNSQQYDKWSIEEDYDFLVAKFEQEESIYKPLFEDLKKQALQISSLSERKLFWENEKEKYVDHITPRTLLLSGVASNHIPNKEFFLDRLISNEIEKLCKQMSAKFEHNSTQFSEKNFLNSCLHLIGYWLHSDETVINLMLDSETKVIANYVEPFNTELNSNLIRQNTNEGKRDLIKFYVAEFWELQEFYKQHYEILFTGSLCNYTPVFYEHTNQNGSLRKLNEFENYVVNSWSLFNMLFNEIQLCCIKYKIDFFKICNELNFSLKYFDIGISIAFEEMQKENLLPQQTETKTEQDTHTFTNNFDTIKPTEIYKHFKAGLVKKGYLTEQELNEYLKAAFELKTIPETLFKIKNAPKKAAIEAVFYTYYKNIAGKIHGTQRQYAALLGDYFEGYKTTTVSSNFSKSVY